jgi:peptidyl-prolyl cis-trans isomerase SurA
MKVGGISKPYNFADQRGEPFFRLVQLQSRTDPHVASLEKDYSKIQMAAIEQKKASFLSNWIQQKVDATYIQIGPSYQSCEALAKWFEAKTGKP